MSYSLDFRRQVLAIKAKENLTFAEAATRFGVGKASVMRWSKCVYPQKTRNKPATKINMQALVADIKHYPDAYHYERAKRLGVSHMGICHALKRLGVSYKKNAEASQGQTRRTACLPAKD